MLVLRKSFSFFTLPSSLSFSFLSPYNCLSSFELCLIFFDHGWPVSVQFVQIDPPLCQELSACSNLSERTDTRHHSSSSVMMNMYPILVPKIREEVNINFCVPVYFPSFGNERTSEGKMPVLNETLGIYTITIIYQKGTLFVCDVLYV